MLRFARRCAEVRHCCIHPLTSAAEAPGTAITVSQHSSALAAGQHLVEWRALPVHPYADIAAAVSVRGALVPWALAPMEPLELAAGSSSSSSAGAGVLPASWSSCSAAAWLAAAAQLDDAAPAGQLPLVVASAGQGVVELAQLVLAPSASSSRKHAGLLQSQQPQRLAAVHLLASLPLPPGVGVVSHMAELCVAAVHPVADAGFAAGSAPATFAGEGAPAQVVRASLVALAARAVSGSSSPHASWLGQQQEGEQEEQQEPNEQVEDVWVVWQLELRAAAASDGSGSGGGTEASVEVSVLGLDVCATAGGQGGWEPEPGARLSCLHSPSAASPFVMTGDSGGGMQLWQLGLGGRMELLQGGGCSLPGHDMGGITVAVALATAAGYAAAATTCGQVCCAPVGYERGWCSWLEHGSQAGRTLQLAAAAS